MESMDTKRLSKALEDLKCLLILIASKSGASQPEIAKALGISDRHLRRLMNRKERSDEVAESSSENSGTQPPPTTVD